MDTREVESAIQQLQKEVRELKERPVNQTEINSFSSNSVKEGINDIVKERISDTVWNDFFYTSNFVPFTLIVTTGAETKQSHGDTSGGNIFTPERACKFRAGIYFGAAGLGNNATTYITTAHIRTDSTTPTATLANGAEFVGFKIVNNVVYLCSYSDRTKKEVLRSTKKTIVGGETVIYGINFYPRERADFFMNNEYVGSISEQLPLSKPSVFYPIYISLKRSDGLTHNVNVDFYEFLQARK